MLINDIHLYQLSIPVHHVNDLMKDLNVLYEVLSINKKRNENHLSFGIYLNKHLRFLNNLVIDYDLNQVLQVQLNISKQKNVN